MEADVSEDLKPNEATQETAVSRREFGAVSLAAGLAVVAGARGAEAAERPLTETEVIVKTPDGNCDGLSFIRRQGLIPACSFGRTPSGCAPPCASSPGGLRPTAIRSWSLIRFT